MSDVRVGIGRNRSSISEPGNGPGAYALRRGWKLSPCLSNPKQSFLQLRRGREAIRATRRDATEHDFREIWRDDDLVLVRGRFPLTAMVSWAGGHDTIAIIPDSDVCLGFLETGVASIEFRASGRQPLVLIDRNNLCPITGFALPLPPEESSDSGPPEIP